VRSILVVDDEFGIADVLQEILTDAGYGVAVALNGRQGLERARELAPDLVLADFMMPVLDGPGLLRALAGDPALAVIPVVMMSSLPEATVIAACGPLRLAGFLRKPFRIAAVLRAIALALGEPPPEG
jgi:CheY-like chemotaxis protein